MASKNIEIPIDNGTAYRLLKKGLADGINKEAVAECLMETMDKDQIAMVIMLLQLEEEYVPLIPGDYVRFRKDSVYFLDKYDTDVLIDMGLMSGEYMFGQIANKDDYGHNTKRFSPRVSVNMMVYGEEKVFTMKSERMDRLNLELIIQEQIPYYQKLGSLEPLQEELPF